MRSGGKFLKVEDEKIDCFFGSSSQFGQILRTCLDYNL